MIAILIGASPFASAALTRLGLPFLLVVEPGENPSRTASFPVRVVTRPYASDPMSILTLPLGAREQVAGVFSTTELGLLPAALLAEALNVPAIPVSSVLRTRNKFHMRRLLEGHVPQPQFGLLSHEHLPSDLPYPIVIKPVDGSGSEHVQYIANAAQLHTLSLENRNWLWEEFIDGQEFSVEAVSCAGEHIILGITEKITTGPPHFVEVSHLTPAALSLEEREHITSTVSRCLDILGVHVGATHTEVKYRPPHTFMIETHTRPGGDRIPCITELVHGYEQYELSARSILGLPLPEAQPCQFSAAAVHYFQWPPGEITQILGVEAARHRFDVVELRLDIAPGSVLVPWTNSDDRPGFVVLGGSTLDEARTRMRAIQHMISILYKEKDISS